MKRKQLLMKMLLAVAMLGMGTSNAWAQVSTWTYSGTLTSNTFGAEFDGSTADIVKVQLGSASESTNWVVYQTSNTNRGVRCSGTATATLTDNIPTAGTFMKVRVVSSKNVSFVPTIFRGGKGNLYIIDEEAPATKVLNARYGGSSSTVTATTLTAGHTYYVYFTEDSGYTTNFCFTGFTATTIESYSIHYVDDSATPVTIKDDVVYSGNYGSEVTASSDDMANVVYNDVTYAYESGNETITLGSSTNEITLVYASATPATAKIKYVATIASVETEIQDAVEVVSAVGKTVTPTSEQVPTYITYDGKKYVYQSGNESKVLTGDAESDVIKLVYVEAAKYSYTVNAKYGETLLGVIVADGSDYENESVSYSYPACYLVDGTLYYKAAISNNFSTKFTLSSDNYVENVSYSQKATDVVFFSEGEDVDGLTKTIDGVYCDSRMSGKAGGYTTEETDITTLLPGKYKICARVMGTATYTFTAGGVTVYTVVASGNIENETVSSEFEITTPTTIKVDASGSAGTTGVVAKAIDFLYIYKTGDPTYISASIGSYGYASFSSTYPVDFTSVEGLTVYKATSANTTTVHMEEVTGAVAANTGLVLKGAAGTYVIPVAASGTSLEGNLLFACDGSWTEVTPANSGTNFVLSVQDEKVVWAPVISTNAPMSAGQAALWADVSISQARGLRMVFDGESTGIESLDDMTISPVDRSVYDLQGRKWSNGQMPKGLYIVDGKKVVVK